MKKAYRLDLQKLLIVSLLFFQFSLAFHSHDAGEEIHCDSCISHAMQQSSADNPDGCVFNAFYHANLVSSFADTGNVVAELSPLPGHFFYNGYQPLNTPTLPFGSRAPPTL